MRAASKPGKRHPVPLLVKLLQLSARPELKIDLDRLVEAVVSDGVVRFSRVSPITEILAYFALEDPIWEFVAWEAARNDLLGNAWSDCPVCAGPRNVLDASGIYVRVGCPYGHQETVRADSR